MGKTDKRLLIIGTGGHSRSVIDLVHSLADMEIIGLVDDYKPTGELVQGYSVLGGINDIPSLKEKLDFQNIVIAIGDNWARHTVFNTLTSFGEGFRFPVLIHPAAYVSDDTLLGEGIVIMAGAVVNAGTKIGRHCLINTKASVDHDCRLGDFSSIAPGVTMGGYAKIGSFSAIGIGATLSDRAIVGQHTVVGAGALVLNEVEDYAVAYGVPAKVVRSRKCGEKYL